MHSDVYRDFGITEDQAVIRDIIRSRWECDSNKGAIFKGWVCLFTGNLHKTKYDAVKEWWELKGKPEKEAAERWNTADVHYFYFKDLGVHRLQDRRTHEILLQTMSQEDTMNYIKDFCGSRKVEKRVLEGTLYFYSPDGMSYSTEEEFQSAVEQKMEEAKKKLLEQPWIEGIIVAIKTPYDAYFAEEKNEFWSIERFKDRCRELESLGAIQIWKVSHA